MFAEAGGKQTTDEEVFRLRTEYTHIVARHQDGHGAYDRLQWRTQIGGFLGDFHGHPG